MHVLAGTTLIGCFLLPITLSNAQDTPPVNLSGVWSTNSLDTLENPAWNIEGHFSCRCTNETYEYLRSLQYDPSNDYL